MKQILIVDDEESLRRTFEVFLVGAGYQVSSSGSAEEAMWQLRRRAFDTVITDIVMPGADGIAVLQAVREQDTERPVILMTGNPSLTSATEAVRGGAFDYLAKPVKKDQLLQTVRRAIDRYSLIQEKRRLEETNERQARMLAGNVRQLESLSVAKERLAALLVHDFKNPLSAIISNLGYLGQQPAIAGDTNLSAALGDADAASHGLLRMITMLLDISRMEEERMTLHREEAALVEVAEAAVARWRAEAGDRGVRFEVAVPPELRLSIDRMLIERVLDNLLSNGLRYTPPRGLIRMSAEVVAERVVLAVENNGPGIPESARALIFDKYGQVEPYPERAPITRGLGLYFCRLAIEAHHGSISVEDPPGGGARFRIELPLSAPASDAPPG